jgi:hypothetical protein
MLWGFEEIYFVCVGVGILDTMNRFDSMFGLFANGRVV